jgi:glycosyltransferase involved in cell wall biosynthesis
MSAGRLTESQKDFTMLIKGYTACVKKYGIAENLVILGDGPSRPMLETLAREEGMKDRVIFPGYRENPYNWMRNSKLFLFCSKFEGLPTVLIEALSLSCPIIATATPTGVTEILMNGKSGMLVKPGDIEGLCKTICSLSTNVTLQQSYADSAPAILEKFEINYMVGQFEKLVVE